MKTTLLDFILSKPNMRLAYENVKKNKGTCGVDNIKIEDIDDFIKENWKTIEDKIRRRKYKPKPVLRVEIPKPNGGVRKLGIPTVMDRIIQQAIAQGIEKIVDDKFSDFSYGFRPRRKAQDAIKQLLEYMSEGYTYIVDIDLEKFFDNVPQDRLMSLVHDHINAPGVESLIMKYLRAGVVVNGVKEPTNIGTPQGGNLSPILSNIMLNELDKLLEERGLRFVRYADDLVIALKSKASANRVMGKITDYIEKSLKLKVNRDKSKVTSPIKLKYLGFGFYYDYTNKIWKCKPHKTSVERFARKLKELTKRNWSISMDKRLKLLNSVIRGWINYFRIGDMKNKLSKIDAHLRTRLRVIIWKQWKTSKKRYSSLIKLGAPKWFATKAVGFGNHYQPVARLYLNRAISKEIFIRRGLISCLDYYLN